MRKTITTFLLSDNPNGIKSVWVENRTCHCIYLTRKELNQAQKRKELNQPALYFLLSQNEGEDKKVYVGETENFKQRITEHNESKDFWNEILVFIASNNSLSKSEVQYLEYLAISNIKEFKNFAVVENKQIPKKPNLPENREEIAKELFEEIKFLCSFLNYNLFQNYSEQKDDLWFCTEKGIDAKAVYTGKTMIVLSDSKVIKNVTDSYQGKEKRQSQMKNRVSEQEEFYMLQENMEFGSPSGASGFCLGRSSNGWDAWKNQHGQTMNDVLRKVKN